MLFREEAVGVEWNSVQPTRDLAALRERGRQNPTSATEATRSITEEGSGTVVRVILAATLLNGVRVSTPCKAITFSPTWNKDGLKFSVPGLADSVFRATSTPLIYASPLSSKLKRPCAALTGPSRVNL